jgi:hypothetical protein
VSALITPPPSVTSAVALAVASAVTSTVALAVASAITSAIASAIGSGIARAPIDVCIDVYLLLLKLDSAIINCKLMPTKELSPSHWLDCEAKSRIRCQAGDDEKHLMVIWLQQELTGEVAVMVVARIEHKPEGLGTGDEF